MLFVHFSDDQSVLAVSKPNEDSVVATYILADCTERCVSRHWLIQPSGSVEWMWVNTRAAMKPHCLPSEVVGQYIDGVAILFSMSMIISIQVNTFLNQLS